MHPNRLGSSTQVHISVVGDSWVADGKLDSAIHDVMTASGVPVTVSSSGFRGSKSREIYRNLVKSNTKDGRHSLVNSDTDYLVVVAGVNDTAGHIGKDFYAHHMIRIIDFALAAGVTPVVVELPEYGIEETRATGILSWVRELYIYGLMIRAKWM